MKKLIILILILFILYLSLTGMVNLSNRITAGTTVLNKGIGENIKKVAMDYIEGWFEGNADRMTGCLHPDLTKRGIFFVKETGRNRFGIHSASTLIEGTRLGRGKKYGKGQRNIVVKILDISGNMASVKVTCMLTIEYLHLVKYNDEWKVINVLWEPVQN